MTSVLVVDGANVVGSRPDGWWRDRPGAALRLHSALTRTDTGYDQVILVLEGKARAGVTAGPVGTVRTVHATNDGDSTIIELARSGLAPVAVVTADRALAATVTEAGATVLKPSWLLERLEH